MDLEGPTDGGALDYSVSRTDEIINIGIASLSDLQRQRNVLKAAHRKVAGIIGSLGASRHTMRRIKRRIKSDEVVFLAGILATLCVLYVLFRCFR